MNIDGILTDTASQIDFAQGFLSVPVYGAGMHTISLFLDLEYSLGINTYFNEFGVTNGNPSLGQTWEIDEPGYVFGDIYSNFENGLLDNTNSIDDICPDDVSMALAWTFTLAENQTAAISYYFTEDSAFINTYSGFYLTHIDA